jgi:hypothetical protein
MYLDTGHKGKETKLFLKNMERAFQNWAMFYSSQGNWIKTREILEQCVQKHSSFTNCKDDLEKLLSEHTF